MCCSHTFRKTSKRWARFSVSAHKASSCCQSVDDWEFKCIGSMPVFIFDEFNDFAQCKATQDSTGFWIPRSRCRISGAGLRILLLWIPEMDFSEWIPNSASKIFQHSGIRTTLHGAKWMALRNMHLNYFSLRCVSFRSVEMRQKDQDYFTWNASVYGNGTSSQSLCFNFLTDSKLNSR